MHTLITGGTGFIGSALTRRLLEEGGEVTILSRRQQGEKDGCRYIQRLQEVSEQPPDAVVNLAGASLAGRRWSRRYRQEIRDSRIGTTAALVDWLAGLSRPPRVLVSGSAVGYYGHHGDEVLDEEGAIVPGFAQQLCADWEAQAERARESGVRVCLARIGVVLDQGGGALQQMRLPFRLGVANWSGDGQQWLSWIHRQDLVAALLFLLRQEVLQGPFNLTAPQPVDGRGFCEVMQRHHRTWITLPMPAPALKLALGEMAEELLLSGQRVVPARLQAAGFEFRHPDLESALADIL